MQANKINIREPGAIQVVLKRITELALEFTEPTLYERVEYETLLMEFNLLRTGFSEMLKIRNLHLLHLQEYLDIIYLAATSPPGRGARQNAVRGWAYLVSLNLDL